MEAIALEQTMNPETFPLDAPDPSKSGRGERDAAWMLTALAALNSRPMSSTAGQIQAYLSLVCHFLGVRTAFVACLGPESLYIIDVADQDGCPILPDTTLWIEESFCQYVRTTGAPIVIPDARHDVRVREVASRQMFTIGAYVGVPVLLPDGDMYGTLCALDPQPQLFTSAQVDVMRIIAAQIAPLLAPSAVTPVSTARSTPPAAHPEIDSRTFFEVVTHDLRSPLMSIVGYTDLLIHEFGGPLTDDQREMLDQIHSSARFMNRLVNDLYDVAVLESAALMLVTEEFDPQRLATEVLAEHRSAAQAKQVDLRLTSRSAPPTIIGDRDRLRQILHNFLSNGLRYTAAGTILLHVECQEEVIIFQVTDSGPGIPEDALDRIWERGHRLSSAGNGLGIGLYIVRQLATAMGGTVGVESTVGVGSTFWLRLPIHGPPPQKLWRTW